MKWACVLLPVLVSASAGEFRWSTPYPDGRTQNLLAVVSPTEFFMAASKITGIHHYKNGAWSWIPPPPDVPQNALAHCIGTRIAGTKVMVIVEGTPVTYNEYTIGANSWAQTSLRNLQVGGDLACFMTSSALFVAGVEATVYDLGLSVRSRPSTNLCNITSQPGCNFIAGNGQVVYTFTGPAGNQHLLKYNSTDWTDLGVVNTTISQIDSLALAADGTVYVAGSGSLAQSRDQGVSWTRLVSVGACGSNYCNKAIYAANDVVLLASLEQSGLYAYNLSSGTYAQRSFDGRAAVVAGIANTAFIMGAHGSVWQTAMLEAGSTPLIPVTGGIFIDYSIADSPDVVCQLQGISGSMSTNKVYAVSSGCGAVGSMYEVSLPTAANWTRAGPLQTDFPDLPLGIFALPFSEDIWLYSESVLARYHSGMWTITPLNRALIPDDLVAIHGSQDSSGSSTVIALMDSSLWRVSDNATGLTFLNFPSDGPLYTALYVHNATTFFVGSNRLVVSFDGGATAQFGTKSTTSPASSVRALYYRSSVDVILLADDMGLWQSVGGASDANRLWTPAMSANGPLSSPFGCIWARNDNDIYASGEQQNIIWHFDGGSLWTAILAPVDAGDSYYLEGFFGIRGIWGTPAGDTYAVTRVGVISSPLNTPSPTRRPTHVPSKSPTLPTSFPTMPTKLPTRSPTVSPTTRVPTPSPTTLTPTPWPTRVPTLRPTRRPSRSPTTLVPTPSPTRSPSQSPTVNPTFSPSFGPTLSPTTGPTSAPTIRECVCLDDCQYKGIALAGNGVCEDAGPGGNGWEHPELAACAFGHDCTDCGTANRTAFKHPLSCDPKSMPPTSGTLQHSMWWFFLNVLFFLILH